jgi:peptidoglycan/LPS O-acetylase OafA/YrhL
MADLRRHFHTFDALRFFSFFIVFLHHSPIPNSSLFSFFTKSGRIGVSFFFTLSGFLITYILLHEKKIWGKISLKKFFIRRILRIWPLFYIMIIFSFLTPSILDLFNISYSNEGYQPSWPMSFLFLENYEMMITNNFPNVSPLRVMWSLCIEEHFYIFWGIFISILPTKKTPFLIIISILIANISRIIYNNLGIPTLDLFTNIDYFAYGAIPAYILIFREDIILKLEKISVIYKYIWVLFTLLLIFGIPNLENHWIIFFEPTIFGICFSGVIASTLSLKNEFRINDNLWISKLGIYTYGLYLFHTIMINLFLKIKIYNSEYEWLLTTSLSLFTTIIISIISYHIFEKQFLKLKKFFY